MPARAHRAFLLASAALTLGLASGCPVHRTCPNCEYRTATFDAADVSTWTAAKLDTYIDHDASASSDSCPLGGAPSPCITDNKDEPVLCRVKQLDGGKASVMLAFPSLADAAHKITLHITKGTVSQTLATTTVGAPTDTVEPSRCTR